MIKTVLLATLIPLGIILLIVFLVYSRLVCPVVRDEHLKAFLHGVGKRRDLGFCKRYAFFVVHDRCRERFGCFFVRLVERGARGVVCVSVNGVCKTIEVGFTHDDETVWIGEFFFEKIRFISEKRGQFAKVVCGEFVGRILDCKSGALVVKFESQLACGRERVFGRIQCLLCLLCKRYRIKRVCRKGAYEFLRVIFDVDGVFGSALCVVKDVLRAVYGKLVFVVEFLVQVRLKVVCFGNEFVEGQREGILDGYAVLLRSFHEAIGCDVEVLNG